MKITKYDVEVPAVTFICKYQDFDHEKRDWQESYFELLSWKNTWSLCRELDMLSRRNDDGVWYPFVRLVMTCDDEYKDYSGVLEDTNNFLERLGYKPVSYEGTAWLLHVDEFQSDCPDYYIDE